MTTNNTKILCLACLSRGKTNKMHKAGKVWSGYNRRQRYKCPKCGATKLGELIPNYQPL